MKCLIYRAALLTCLLAGLLVLAEPTVAGPPEVSIRSATAQWVGFAVMFILLVPVLAVSLMPSKRGHQD